MSCYVYVAYSMLKKPLLSIFLFISLGSVFGAPVSMQKDSLLSILKHNERPTRERDLIFYIRYEFGDMSREELVAARKTTVDLLHSFHVPDSEGLIYFIDAICKLRQNNYTAAQGFLVKAMEKAYQNDDHYLLYACFTHMGFIQTDKGNTIAAVSSFRNAKKEADVLNDTYLQVVIDINLSDIYYRNRMFGQSLLYLNEGQSYLHSAHIKNPRLQIAILYNKAEVFFRSQNADSLKKYNELLNALKQGSPGLYTFQKRADYYLELLYRKYARVIKTITRLRSDSLYQFKVTDERCLAEAYFQAGMPDSAKKIVEKLIRDTSDQNHTELNLYFYKLLGDIENKQHNYEAAADDFNIALSQALEQQRRLVNVGSVSSLIRIDQLQNSYALRTETYKRERLWLFFIISVITFFIIIGAMLYYNVHRNKYYEKLLFESQKKEIAFINSHEVRRHASNIMGIMQVINQGENKFENFTEAEEYLISELNSLDEAIRNISDKLNS